MFGKGGAVQCFLPARISFVGIKTVVVNESFERHLKVDPSADGAIYRSIIEALSLSFLSLVEFIIGRQLIEGQRDLRGSAPHYKALYDDRVAAALFITKRTLARGLEANGASYRLLEEEIRSTLVSRYIQDSNLSVEAIAAILGYQGSANFRRVFKRWFSMTPSAYQQGHVDKDDL